MKLFNTEPIKEKRSVAFMKYFINFFAGGAILATNNYLFAALLFLYLIYIMILEDLEVRRARKKEDKK